MTASQANQTESRNSLFYIFGSAMKSWLLLGTFLFQDKQEIQKLHVRHPMLKTKLPPFQNGIPPEALNSPLYLNNLRWYHLLPPPDLACFTAGCCWLLDLTWTNLPSSWARTHPTFLQLRFLLGGVAWTTRPSLRLSHLFSHGTAWTLQSPSIHTVATSLGYTCPRARFLRIF